MKRDSCLKPALGLVAFISFGATGVVFADNCPPATEAAQHAVKDGVGATWGAQSQWYLDYFSSGKPDESRISKFTFLQANFKEEQLTCYYGWPDADGRTTAWMTVRLKTTQVVKPDWQGLVCQNFTAEKCTFTLTGEAAPAVPAPAPTPVPGGAVAPDTGAVAPEGKVPSPEPAPMPAPTPSAPGPDLAPSEPSVPKPGQEILPKP